MDHNRFRLLKQYIPHTLFYDANSLIAENRDYFLNYHHIYKEQPVVDIHQNP